MKPAAMIGTATTTMPIKTCAKSTPSKRELSDRTRFTITTRLSPRHLLEHERDFYQQRHAPIDNDACPSRQIIQPQVEIHIQLISGEGTPFFRLGQQRNNPGVHDVELHVGMR